MEEKCAQSVMEPSSEKLAGKARIAELPHTPPLTGFSQPGTLLFTVGWLMQQARIRLFHWHVTSFIRRSNSDSSAVS
jgi:hypothetical protein